MGRISYFSTFTCPETEQAFRQKNLRQDLRLSIGLVLTAAVGAIFFILHDFALFGASAQFFGLLALRSALILVSLAVVSMLRRCSSSVRADLIVFVWCLVLSMAHAYAVTTRPVGFVWHTLMCIGLVYAIVPVPLRLQICIAAIFSITIFGLEIWLGLDVLSLVPLAGAFVLINGIGILTSWQLNKRRRQVHSAWLRETKLRQQMEQVLAEVKTLRGLLPICAWCKKIREEDQWLPIEEYVQEHSLANFTHGICPHCLGEQGNPSQWPPAVTFPANCKASV